MLPSSWESLSQAKKSSISESIPQKWKFKSSELPTVTALRDVSDYIRRFLSASELTITDLNASAILAKVRRGEWTSVEVTTAFCHRAALSHQLVNPRIRGKRRRIHILSSPQVNCLSEVFFESAIQRAQELDIHYQKLGTTIGPLHGLPISLQDRFNIRGVESACGFVDWLGKKKSAESEGVLVTKLRQAGAVFYVKTNVPMSMLVR